MSKRSLIDDAYRRGRILNAVLLQARERAKQDPLNERWLACGLVDAGDKKDEALKSINQTFDSLSEFISYITILDMAASFEEATRRRLATHIGEARKRITNKKPSEMPSYSEKFLRDGEDFKSLASIWTLMDGRVGIDVTSNFEALKEVRNLFAHGSQQRGAPKIDVDTARLTLDEMFSRL